MRVPFLTKIANYSHSKLFTEEPEKDSFLGTPLYHSPQRLVGMQCSASDDIWALGCILSELMSGHLPFYGENY